MRRPVRFAICRAHEFTVWRMWMGISEHVCARWRMRVRTRVWVWVKMCAAILSSSLLILLLLLPGKFIPHVCCFFIFIWALVAHTHFGQSILTLRMLCVHAPDMLPYSCITTVCASVFNVCINIYALSDVHRRDDDGWVCELYLRVSIGRNTITSFVIVIIIISLCSILVVLLLYVDITSIVWHGISLSIRTPCCCCCSTWWLRVEKAPKRITIHIHTFGVFLASTTAALMITTVNINAPMNCAERSFFPPVCELFFCYFFH